ncbi:sigma-70 family RNA polymerase sigma factor [Streptomyces longisporus]|uniref:sigma-70 family RNA polymerase sigma factor n=1 Tax=Streptomyces longisporus TaxID=1948 RepID=UPI0031DC023F
MSNDARLSSQLIDDLVAGISRLPPGPERDAAREGVIRRLLPLARRIAAKYRTSGGEDQDDLVQVACLGLIKAVDGYDPERGHAFLSYALPTVTGELKRHLRDRTALVRLPRSLQEARLRVVHAQRELEQRLAGRAPTPAEIAEVSGLSPEAVVDALQSDTAAYPRSLDAPPPGAGDSWPDPAEVTGDCDPALEFAADRVTLMRALQRLPVRERRILFLRFFHDQPQQQIATAVGLSQMHVSRLLARCLARLREELEGGAAAAEADSPAHTDPRTAERPTDQPRHTNSTDQARRVPGQAPAHGDQHHACAAAATPHTDQASTETVTPPGRRHDGPHRWPARRAAGRRFTGPWGAVGAVRPVDGLWARPVRNLRRPPPGVRLRCRGRPQGRSRRLRGRAVGHPLVTTEGMFKGARHDADGRLRSAARVRVGRERDVRQSGGGEQDRHRRPGRPPEAH